MNLYNKIAKENKTTEEEVEREIAYAIEQAYKQNPQHELFKNGIPTNQEFMDYVLNRVYKK